MNKVFSSFLIAVLVFIFPVNSYAHSADQLPYFKINDKYTAIYPVAQTSTKDLFIPQDLAPENYLVGQNLDLQLDTTNLPILPQLLNQMNLDWDYGDGTAHGEGLKNVHSYQKPGSYFLDIYIQIGQDLPQLLQSTLINVLPDKNYQLPKAVILINGEDKTGNVATVNFNKDVKLDGSKSRVSGGTIEYFWDLGDGNVSKEKNISRKYQENYFYYPVLRVKDSNGFISDATVTLTRDNNLNKIAQINNSPKDQIIFKATVGVLLAIIIYCATWAITRLLKRKK